MEIIKVSPKNDKLNKKKNIFEAKKNSLKDERRSYGISDVLTDIKNLFTTPNQEEEIPKPEIIKGFEIIKKTDLI